MLLVLLQLVHDNEQKDSKNGKWIKLVIGQGFGWLP